jgi:hypothetical protein
VLRDVLGPEATLDDRILYGQFAWFMWERIDREKNEGLDVVISPPSPTPTDVPRLAILPARAQRKGINYLADTGHF